VGSAHAVRLKLYELANWNCDAAQIHSINWASISSILATYSKFLGNRRDLKRDISNLGGVRCGALAAKKSFRSFAHHSSGLARTIWSVVNQKKVRNEWLGGAIVGRRSTFSAQIQDVAERVLSNWVRALARAVQLG